MLWSSMIGSIQGEISEEEFQVVQGAADNTLMLLTAATKCRDSYEKQYAASRKLLSASNKEIPLSEIMDCVDKIVVDDSKRIVIKWNV